MLTNKLLFRHSFDEKLHYLNYYSLIELDDNDNEISINDSVQQKKCSQRQGRWNFIKGDSDHSCGVYNLIEVIRQSILFAKEKNKNTVDIALVSTTDDPDICFAFNYDQELHDVIDRESLKNSKIFPQHLNNDCYECDTTVSKKIFNKVVKPVLEQLFIKLGYQLTSFTLKGKFVSERVGSFLRNFRKDLNVIRIEFGVNKIFNKSIIDPKVLVDENELLLITA